MLDNEVSLEATLDKARKDVKAESYPMSIGEIINMYENDEIVLRPEYQRYFRWTPEQKSKLIESILIGLPLPSFFMAQDDEGRWEVVDGMQRLSTIFDFIDILKEQNKKQDGYKRFCNLVDDLYYLKEFANKGWNDLSRRIQLDFKRTKIQLIILMRETNTDAKFELFQRLNSGGTSISGQELRNAILAGENKDMLQWFETLSNDENFIKVTALAEPDKLARYDMELVLRFIVFTSGYETELNKYNSIDVFLTHVLREFIENNNIDYESKKSVFTATFRKIHEVFGDGALKFKNTPGTGKFSISFFEAVALGIAQNIDNLPSDNILKEKINSIGNDDEYNRASGSGKNVKSRIPALMTLGKKYFSNN